MMDTSDNEDMHSQHSHSSLGMPMALTKKDSGDLNASELEKSPISVKEMIKRYNTAAMKTPTVSPSANRQQSLSPPHSARHELTSHSSSYCELNKYSDLMADNGGSGEDSSMRRSGSVGNVNFANCFGAGGEEYIHVPSRHSSMTGLNNDMGEYIADHTCRSTRAPSFLDETCEVQFLATGACQMASRKSSTVILNKSAPNLTASLDSCYQSKTVISKTSMGVRITIDIFFDEGDQPLLEMDMIGSRIETDIPQSRILQEFQQEAKQKTKPELKDGELV